MQNNNYDETIFLPNCNLRTHTITGHDDIPHSHHYIEIFYIIEGSITHVRNKTPQKVSVRDMEILEPFRDTHFFKRENDERCMHRDIMFPCAFFEKACEFVGVPYNELIYNKNTPSTIDWASMQLLEGMIDTILVTNDIYKKNILVNLLVVHVITQLYIKKEKTASSQIDAPPPWFKDFLQLFNKADIVSGGLTDMKKYMTCSYEHASRIHKQIMGITIVEHLTNVRMAYAANLLKSTDLSILSIAMEVGYNSLSHFNHTFKKHYGLSPNAYKKNKI